MFNIGPGELLAICVVALIVLGPQRLPQALRSVGRAAGELRRLSGNFQDEFKRAIDDSELAEMQQSSAPRTNPAAAASADSTIPADSTTSATPADSVGDDEPARIELPPPDGNGEGGGNDETGDTSDSRTA